MSELRRKPEVDYYKVLQVDSEAEPEVVEAAYRALSKKYHPDVNPVPEAADKMSQINTAYAVLGDASKRRDYNLLRGSLNHYIKAQTASSTSSSATNTYRPATNTSTASNYTRPASNPANSNGNPTYKAGAATGSTARPTANTTARPTSNPNNTTNKTQASPNRPRNPYQNATSNSGSTRAEAQNRAKGGSRAGHYIYDAKKKLSAGRLVVLLVGLIVLVALFVLLQEIFLNDPLGTHFVSPNNAAPVSSVFEPIQPAQTIATATPLGPATAPTSDGLTRENALAFLQTSNEFAKRIGTTPNDIALINNGDTLQLKIKLGDKPGSNADIAANSTPVSSILQNDPLTQLRNSETTAYAVIYALFRQFSPQLQHIVLGLTNQAGDSVVYKMDVTRAAAFGFYPWQTINANMPASDLATQANDDRLASHFGAPQDDKSHNLLLNPDVPTISAEIASRGIEGTTVNIEPSGTVTVSYLLNTSTPETQQDFVKILYALYTRFSNFDTLNITTAVAGQSGGISIWCNRELFNKVGVATWAQKIYQSDVQELFSSLPKTEALLRQQTVVNPATPQPVNSTLRVRTWQVDVVKTEQLNGVPNYAPNGNSQLWAVTVNLRNSSSLQLYPMPDEVFSLVDGQRHFYQPDIAASVQYNLNNNYPNLVPLPAGQVSRLTLIFSLPRTSNNQKLSLQVRDGDVKNLVYLQ